MAMITDPNVYFLDGCGRCNKFETDACKARLWSEPLAILRDELLKSGLEEQAKWGQPTYTLNGKNVALVFSFNDACGISFFKGVLLKDDHQLLVAAGENSHVARLLKVTHAGEAEALRPLIAQYIEEAISLERAGAQVPKREAGADPMPVELEELLAEWPAAQAAWERLTPGRQRSYLIHINGAKQSATRRSRAEKSLPKIMSGKGQNER